MFLYNPIQLATYSYISLILKKKINRSKHLPSSWWRGQPVNRLERQYFYRLPSPSTIIKQPSIPIKHWNVTRRLGSYSSRNFSYFLVRKCDVLNRGFAGYNTRWNKILLPRIITKEMASDIAAVTIFLGTNDSNNVELYPRPHVPVEEYKQNLIDMISYLIVCFILIQYTI